MDLNLLPLFLAVVDAGSMSTAAARLGLPKSSVSRGVARLEAALGVQLFFRSTRRLSVSTAGRALAERVRPLLGALPALVDGLPEQDEEPAGSLRLTAPVDIGLAWLPGFTAKLLERYPRLELDVRLSNDVVDLVGGGFDAALRVGGRLPDSTLIARRLAQVTFEAYAAPAYLARRGTPRTCAELANHARVGLGQAKWPAPFDPGGKPWVTVNDVLLCRELVREGLGVGLLPSFIAQGAVTRGELVRVLPRVQARVGSLFLVHPRVARTPRKIVALRELLVEYLAERPL
jgi:DNA-binding transcriptional LysR family regulator